MTSETINNIIEFQRSVGELPMDLDITHNPDMLLIGCVDARLNPSADIGVPYGKALIKRNIAALVPPNKNDGSGVGAVLEFAINKKEVKDIVVMGHTHCGGIAACLDGVEDPEIEKYLKPLDKGREIVVKQGGSVEEQARNMEREAVRQSLDNLMTYEVVRLSVENGEIEMHGWIIDVETRKLSVLDKDSGEFKPMIKENA